MSTFANVTLAAPVPVFQLTADFKADSNPKKVNLGVGAYRTDKGEPWVLPVVRKVEQQLANDLSLNHEYLPIQGLPEFTERSARLALGEGSKELDAGRACGVQTISGTGSLRLAADFLFKYFGGESTTILHSQPTWGNHMGIFKAAGFTQLKPYPYWDAKNRTVDIEGFCRTLEEAPDKSVVIFHCCAHNPTGSDPTHDQWIRLSQICKSKGHFPVFDTAYQGFASGDPESDAWSLRYFVQQEFELFACQSYAKNFGLYNERAGCLTIVLSDKEALKNVRSQIELIIRTNYSNPPAHGARIVATTLSTPEFYAEWRENVRTMANRIIEMRGELRERMEKLGTPGNWDHITKQIGMFSFTGLNTSQCLFLKQNKSIYLMPNGRINMAAVNSANIDYLAENIDEAVRTIE